MAMLHGKGLCLIQAGVILFWSIVCACVCVCVYLLAGWLVDHFLWTICDLVKVVFLSLSLCVCLLSQHLCSVVFHYGSFNNRYSYVYTAWPSHSFSNIFYQVPLSHFYTMFVFIIRWYPISFYHFSNSGLLLGNPDILCHDIARRYSMYVTASF